MTGNEFIRRVKKLGREKGIAVKYVARRGKGSHGTLFFGSQFTVVRTQERPMLVQLGLTIDEL